MTASTPVFEHAPLFALLDHGPAGASPLSIEAWLESLPRLVGAVPGAVALSIPWEPHKPAWLSLAAEGIALAARYHAPLWLRLPAPCLAGGAGLCYRVQDIGAAMVAGWRLPDDQEIVSAVAAPLGGPRQAPQWADAVILHGLSPDEQRARLQRLVADAGARIWIWTEAAETPPPRPGLTAEPFWLDVLPALLHACQQAGASDAIAGLYLDASAALPEAADRFPWMPGLPDYFLRAHGYDLLERLPSLVADTGPEAVRVRQHYWASLYELFFESCWQPLRQHAGRLGLLLAGGLGAHVTPSQLAASGIGVRQLVACLDMPGIISPAHGEAKPGGASSGALLPPRLLASAAQLQGGKPVIAQIWNGSCWADTLAESLSHIHSLWQAGISELQLYSIGAAAQGEVPSFHLQPFHEAWPGIASYLQQGRAYAALDRSAARVALLWPRRSIQSHYNPRGHRITRWVEEDLAATAGLLDELHFDFLFVEEEDLLQGEIVNLGCDSCRLLCGAARHAFEMIVLPSVTALSRGAWRQIEEFARAGGKVVCLGLLPRWSENGRDNEFEEIVGKTTRIVVADLYDAWAQSEGAACGSEEPSVIGYPVVRSWTSGGRLGCYQPRLNHDAGDARLRVRQMLNESMKPGLESQAAQIRLARRVSDRGENVSVVNQGAQSARVNVRVRPCNWPVNPMRVDAWTSATSAVRDWMELSDLDGGGMACSLELAAGELCLLPLAREAPLRHVERANFEVGGFDGETLLGWATEGGYPHASVRRETDGRIERWQGDSAVELPAPRLLADGWQAIPATLNAARLDGWQWRPGRETAAGTKQAATWYPLGSPADAGVFRRVLSHSDTECVTWRGSFRIEEAELQLWLRVQAAGGQVRFAGRQLTPQNSPLPGSAMWNEGCSWFDLGVVGQGRHTVDFICPALPGEARPVPCPLLAGAFLVTGDGTIAMAGDITEMEPGPWQEQGFPYYNGQMELRRREMIPAHWARCRVYLEMMMLRDMVQPEINGRRAEFRGGPPYRFDITESLVPGEENEITLRFFSTADVLRGQGWERPAPAGLLGPARLVAYPSIRIERPQ